MFASIIPTYDRAECSFKFPCCGNCLTYSLINRRKSFMFQYMNLFRSLVQNYWVFYPIFFNKPKKVLTKILTPFLTFEYIQVLCPYCMKYVDADKKIFSLIYCYECKELASHGDYIYVDQYDRLCHIGCINQEAYLKNIHEELKTDIKCKCIGSKKCPKKMKKNCQLIIRISEKEYCHPTCISESNKLI